jgi:dihydroflavonol-4-reductase
VDEESTPDAEYESDFVRMKYEAETLVLEANRPGALRTLVVSPGVVASPGADTVLGGLIGAFLTRELPVRLLDGVWIALTDARDVGPCVAAAIERGQGGHRYFATGECLKLGALYDRLAARTGVPAPRRHLPDLLVEELGLLVPLLPPQSFLRRLVLPRELVFHLRRLAPVRNARTRAELGFTPTATDVLLEDLAAEAGAPAARARAEAGGRREGASAGRADGG